MKNTNARANRISWRPLLTFCAAAAVFSVISCSKKAKNGGEDSEEYSSERLKMETAAAPMLAEARTRLAAGDHSGARAAVERMRKDCYLALTARRQGILLMDSIDIAQARLELVAADSVLRKDGAAAQADFDEACRKVQFYELKLRHDSGKTR